LSDSRFNIVQEGAISRLNTNVLALATDSRQHGNPPFWRSSPIDSSSVLSDFEFLFLMKWTATVGLRLSSMLRQVVWSPGLVYGPRVEPVMYALGPGNQTPDVSVQFCQAASVIEGRGVRGPIQLPTVRPDAAGFSEVADTVGFSRKRGVPSLKLA
jgi:hypothetical protein